MPVINESVTNKVKDQFNEKVRDLIVDENYHSLEKLIGDLIGCLHGGIEEKKRTSYGIVYVVNYLCKYIYIWTMEVKVDPYELGLGMVEHFHNFRTLCVGFGIVSHVGVREPEKAWPVILRGADHEQWEVKEFIQMFVRKMTKANKTYIQERLIDLTQSTNPNYRRFASEALRPVVENKWIQDNPEYSVKVLRFLFKESHEFPRVSVGNNLSDLSRKNPELIYGIVKELVGLQDENSDFIAHRACRNLVKSDAERVLDLLGLEVYAYKGQKFMRNQKKG